MNVTTKQKEIMIQWMKSHLEGARGRLRRKKESRNVMMQLLEDLATTINEANVGPKKNGAEWFKTWKDWQMYVLKKETKRRSHCLGTGGGSPIHVPFSPLEEELLDFITPEAAGLENIPQGGIYSCENMDADDVQTRENIPQGGIYSCENMDADDVQTRENIHFEETELPHRISRTNDQLFRQNNTGLRKQSLSSETSHIQKGIQRSHTRSLSCEMVEIQKEKLDLKKEEVVIQKQLLQVQRSILTELKQIRSTVDTYGHLE